MNKKVRRITISWKGNQWSVGEQSKSKSRRNRCKSRTPKTYNNKLRNIKKQYNKKSKFDKFKDKYPTFDSFLKKHNLRQPGRKEPEKIVSSSVYNRPKISGWLK